MFLGPSTSLAKKTFLMNARSPILQKHTLIVCNYNQQQQMSLLKKTSTTMALLSLPSMSHSFTVAIPQNLRVAVITRPVRRRPAATFVLKAGPFFGPEEEFECPDEEECEIDWDLMPGFEDDGNSAEEEEEDESDVDMQPRPNFGSQALDSLEKGRVRLQMNWQIDECETDKDTCSDFCPDCAGSGRQPCRFCRGTGIVSLGNEFRPCLICANAVVGQEDCALCRGTGQIAPWASTMEDHFKKDEEKPKNLI